MHSASDVRPSAVWYMGEILAAISLCFLPIAFSGGVNEASLTRGLVLATALIVVSEFFRHFIGFERARSFFSSAFALRLRDRRRDDAATMARSGGLEIVLRQTGEFHSRLLFELEKRRESELSLLTRLAEEPARALKGWQAEILRQTEEFHNRILFEMERRRESELQLLSRLVEQPAAALQERRSDVRQRRLEIIASLEGVLAQTELALHARTGNIEHQERASAHLRQAVQNLEEALRHVQNQ